MIDEEFNTEILTTSKQRTIIFFVDILDGYSFRQLFDFCKSSVTATPFYITKKSINIKRGNSLNKLILDIVLYGDLFLKYYVNEELFNTKDENLHIITPNLNDFYQQIKNIPKQGSIKLYQCAETPKTLYLQIYGGTKSNNGGYISIKIDDYIHKEYNFDDKIYNNPPTAKTSLSSFCSACDTSIKYRANFATFKCYSDLVIYNVNSESNIDCGKIPWYSDNYNPLINYQETEFFSISITNSILKTLSKLVNINNKGIIKIYCRCQNIMKIILNIGLMGKLTIYIIDDK